MCRAVALAGNIPGPVDQLARALAILGGVAVCCLIRRAAGLAQFRAPRDARALAIGGCTSGGERLGQALLMRWLRIAARQTRNLRTQYGHAIGSRGGL